VHPIDRPTDCHSVGLFDSVLSGLLCVSDLCEIASLARLLLTADDDQGRWDQVAITAAGCGGAERGMAQRCLGGPKATEVGGRPTLSRIYSPHPPLPIYRIGRGGGVWHLSDAATREEGR